MSECIPIDSSILILKCQLKKDENLEIDCIKNSCNLLGISPKIVKVKSAHDIEKALHGDIKYDFIYLSAHGDANGFSGEETDFDMSWQRFGELLCNTDSLAGGCVIMLSCCRGGLNKIAYTLFSICYNIDYITGPRQNLGNCELSTAFTIFLFNYLGRNLDPVVAANNVQKGIGTRLVCFDRLETEETFGYQKYLEEVEGYGAQQITIQDIVKETILQVEASKAQPPVGVKLAKSKASNSLSKDQACCDIIME